jgi:hypothetical protein
MRSSRIRRLTLEEAARVGLLCALPACSSSLGSAPPQSREAGTGDAEARRDSARDAVEANDPAADASDVTVPILDAEADACSGAVAVVGGAVSGASTLAFGATLDRRGSWVVSSLPTNVASPPAIAAFGGGFVAVFVDATGELTSTTFTWSWSSPAWISGVMAVGAPSLAVVGMSLHLVYQGDDFKYVHGVDTAGVGWDAATDPIGGASKQGFGPSAPVAAGVSGMLCIAYGGQNGSLYDETWAAGAWQPDAEHANTSIGALSPAVVALKNGADSTLVVYANPGGTLYFTTRSSGTWSTPLVIDTTAFTGAAPTLVPLSEGRAMMAYLGTNGLPYFSVYDPTATPVWTAPLSIGASPMALLSPPAVAPGVCGSDVIAVVTASAGVSALTYAGGVWSAPTLLPGTAGMSFAAVASQP